MKQQRLQEQEAGRKAELMQAANPKARPLPITTYMKRVRERGEGEGVEEEEGNRHGDTDREERIRMGGGMEGGEGM